MAEHRQSVMEKFLEEFKTEWEGKNKNFLKGIVYLAHMFYVRP